MVNLIIEEAILFTKQNQRGPLFGGLRLLGEFTHVSLNHLLGEYPPSLFRVASVGGVVFDDEKYNMSKICNVLHLHQLTMEEMKNTTNTHTKVPDSESTDVVMEQLCHEEDAVSDFERSQEVSFALKIHRIQVHSIFHSKHLAR